MGDAASRYLACSKPEMFLPVLAAEAQHGCGDDRLLVCLVLDVAAKGWERERPPKDV